MGMVAIGFMIGEGFGAALAILLIIMYIRKRDREYQLMLQLRDAAITEEQMQWVQKAVDGMIDFKNREFALGANFGMSGEPFLCRTCQCSYPSTSHQDTKLCWNLRDIFPHDPHAEPPSPNPYEWYWLKINGYALPPADWPKTKNWLPKTAGDPDSAAAMRKEGDKYYRTHANSMWDRGYGNPPKWYYELAA